MPTANRFRRYSRLETQVSPYIGLKFLGYTFPVLETDSGKAWCLMKGLAAKNTALIAKCEADSQIQRFARHSERKLQ